jgi:hypothetical protein
LKQRARSGDEVAAARAEVEQARAEMTDTVDALQEKLEPRNLEEQAKAGAADAARARVRGLLEAIRQNPIPLAVAGGLLSLLLARRRRGRGSSGGGRGSSAVVFDFSRRGNR